VKISKVIYARWFDKKLVGLRMLYNVFSTFGNIDKMIYLKERSSALVQFETTEFATQAKDALTGLRFFGQTIQVFYANREEVTLKSCILGKGEFKEDPATLEDSFEGCLETNRFQPDLSHTFASPSDSLLLSNLSKQSCSEEIILSVF
jgi:RNA recognition motif-containing protein